MIGKEFVRKEGMTLEWYAVRMGQLLKERANDMSVDEVIEALMLLYQESFIEGFNESRTRLLGHPNKDGVELTKSLREKYNRGRRIP